MRAAAYKTRFAAPYVAGKTPGSYKLNLPLNYKEAQPGVYLIKSNRTGKIIYIGYSSNSLYKTLTRHFQTWNDRRQQRFTYDKQKYSVRVIYTTQARAELLEKYLIMKYEPRDNKLKYEDYLSPAESARAASLEAEAPYISITDDCPF